MRGRWRICYKFTFVDSIYTTSFHRTDSGLFSFISNAKLPNLFKIQGILLLMPDVTPPILRLDGGLAVWPDVF